MRVCRFSAAVEAVKYLADLMLNNPWTFRSFISIEFREWLPPLGLRIKIGCVDLFQNTVEA
jgi:hypothetical protein